MVPYPWRIRFLIFFEVKPLSLRVNLVIPDRQRQTILNCTGLAPQAEELAQS